MQAPEFRIAEDARIATDLPVDLALGLFQSLLNAVTFIGILWSVGDGLPIELGGFVLNIPGYLVIAVIVYSALLSAGIFLIARHLTRVMEENKRTEAELRSIGTHLRESGEGTALPDGKKDARQLIGAALKAVIAIWRIYMWQLMRMTVVTYSSLLVTPVIGLLLCTPKYLDGHDEPRGGGSGCGRVRRRAGRVQLVHRQLSPVSRSGPPPPTASRRCCLRWMRSTGRARQRMPPTPAISSAPRSGGWRRSAVRP